MEWGLYLIFWIKVTTQPHMVNDYIKIKQLSSHKHGLIGSTVKYYFQFPPLSYNAHSTWL